MNRVFADAQYWVALLNDQDQCHAAATSMSQRLRKATLFTSEEVLTEVLAYFSERGRYLRQLAASSVRGIYTRRMVQVVPQSHQSFLDGLTLYESRLDKGYSLTDCISMLAMRQEGITEILTHDAHFAQEGFTILL